MGYGYQIGGQNLLGFVVESGVFFFFCILSMEKRNLFELFIRNRQYLKKAGVNLRYVKGTDCSDCLYIDNPIIISSFAGFVKQHFPDKNIYFRGECFNHPHVIPSLFRQAGKPLGDNGEIHARFSAYNELKRLTIAHYREKVSRFAQEDVDVLFQHYGIHSPVIDLVDNIYVALWFAMDGNTGDHGYIRLMDTSHPDLSVHDLRRLHSSLSLRLHTQHGLIAKKRLSRWNKRNILFDEYEIARIQFPVSAGMLGGELFSRANIYPEIGLDNTFKILKQSTWLEGLIGAMERKHGLGEGVLGRVG
jgi:hypothetical protein